MSDRTVHLVDDDEAVRRSTGFMLKTSGYLVKSYSSGTELLKQKEFEQGCILLDVRRRTRSPSRMHYAHMAFST